MREEAPCALAEPTADGAPDPSLAAGAAAPAPGNVVIDRDAFERYCDDLTAHSRWDEIPALPGPAGRLSRVVAAAFADLRAECAALRRFTGDTAHQLRTPLAVLAARIDAPTAEWDVAQVRADLKWMHRLIDQLLTASRADTAEIAPDAAFDLRALAADVVSALAPLAVYRGRAVALDGKDRSDPVRGSATLAFEALSNLVENALDHTAEGTTVSVATRGDGKVEVRDRGPGVPKEERARIFERFAKGARPTTHGAGMGLSIVAEVMRRHGGGVTVRDRRGGGAIFRLRFQPMAGPSGARQEGVPSSRPMECSPQTTCPDRPPR